MKQSASLVAEKIRVRGTVQGVGFRPTVYRLAQECGLRGTVNNDGQGVLIKAIASQNSLDLFVQRLQIESPPLAKITEIIRHREPNMGDFSDFTIVESDKSQIRTEIPPDPATCSACQEEIFNPLSRWYGYPFTNCIHCGPRSSIIKRLPYDRPKTSMAEFPMCPDCAKDYHNPSDRRFHAQPIACPSCGPSIWLERSGEQGEQGREGGKYSNQ